MPIIKMAEPTQMEAEQVEVESNFSCPLPRFSAELPTSHMNNQLNLCLYEVLKPRSTGEAL